MREEGAALRNIGRKEKGSRGQLVSSSVEAAAHGHPIESPPTCRKLVENGFKNALHFGPVEPTLSRTVAYDGQIVPGYEGSPLSFEPRSFFDEEETPEAKAPGLSNLGELFSRQGNGSLAEPGPFPVKIRWAPKDRPSTGDSAPSDLPGAAVKGNEEAGKANRRSKEGPAGTSDDFLARSDVADRVQPCRVLATLRAVAYFP